jgi:hypothetical protein
VQLNETTRTGANKLHGNATWWYNGSYFNSNNWFLNNSGTHKANTVNNQFAFGLGGPFVKDKAFWFVDFEGIRFVTSNPARVSIPTPTYQAGVLAGLAGSGDPNAAAEIPYYQYLFSLWNNSVRGRTLLADPLDPNSNYYESTPKNSLREGLVALRVDQNFTQNDHVFVHAMYDDGRQPTYVDPMYPEWSDTSVQPEWEGQLAWIRTFSPNVTNQFLATGAHYQAIFQSVNYTAAQALLPYALIFIGTDFYPLNQLDYDFPQGRDATQYSFSDDFSWTKGRHTFKAGFMFKRDDISNFDLGIYNNPLLETFAGSICGAVPSSYCFDSGFAYINRQVFPSGQNLSSIGGTGTGRAPDVPIAFYNMGPYAEDIFKPTGNVTITAGIRFEHNSNPVCQTNCFSRLNQNFWSIAGNDTSSTAYNSVLSTGYHQAFNDLQKFIAEPRIGVNYQFNDRTVLRAGFGMFADVFPAQVTDYMARNAPRNPRFQTIGSYIAPTVAGNGFTSNQGSNAAFFGTGGYAQGGSYSSIKAASGGAFTRPNIYTADPSIKYPTYEEWSLQLQRQFGRDTAIQVAYVGNHGYHEPVVNNSANAWNPGGIGNFDLPAARPAASFGEVVNIQSNASSNYNGLVVSLQHRSKIVSTQINWSWSHAMDMVSNGGFLGFTGSSLTGQIDPYNIRYNYGNADYDTRHNITANYLVNVPNMAHLKPVTNNWTVAGTVFWRTGFPFTVTDGSTTANFGNYYAAMPAGYAMSPSQIPHHCGRNGVFDNNKPNSTGCFNDSATSPTPYFAPANTFHDQERNQFTGPGYFDTDVSVLKGFKMPWEGGLLQVGAQAFNVLNHPNFANPNFDIANAGGFGFGFITGTVGSPTSIYGSGLGGDSSVRILQFKANLKF